jgi:hypothetical protein
MESCFRTEVKLRSKFSNFESPAWRRRVTQSSPNHPIRDTLRLVRLGQICKMPWMNSGDGVLRDGTESCFNWGLRLKK